MYTSPNEPRSIGGVLDDGLRLWLGSIPKTWPLAALAQLSIGLPLIFVAYKLPSAFPSGASRAANAQAMLALLASPTTWLTYLAIIVFTVLFYSAIILRIRAVATNSTLSLGASLSGALRALPWLLLQYLLLIVAFTIVGIVLAVSVGLVSGAVGARAWAAALAPLCILLLGIFLFGRLFLASMAVLLEGEGPAVSFGVSWRLTRGYWWRCAVILTVLVIIGLVFTLVVSFLNGTFAAVFGVASLLRIVGGQLLIVVVNSVLGSLYPAVITAIYFDLKLRKQGGDLLGRVDALARP